MLEKFADLAAAFADQSDDNHVRRRSARDRAEERALADARAGEEADALAFAEREETVEDANARSASGVGRPRRRDERRAADPHRRGTTPRRLRSGPCRRSGGPRPSTDAAEQWRPTPRQREARARRLDLVVGADTGERTERHGDGLAAIEADHLARERIAAALHVDDVADAHARARLQRRREPSDRRGTCPSGLKRAVAADSLRAGRLERAHALFCAGQRALLRQAEIAPSRACQLAPRAPVQELSSRVRRAPSAHRLARPRRATRGHARRAAARLGP